MADLVWDRAVVASALEGRDGVCLGVTPSLLDDTGCEARSVRIVFLRYYVLTF